MSQLQYISYLIDALSQWARKEIHAAIGFMPFHNNIGLLYRWFKVDVNGKCNYGFIRFGERDVFVHLANYAKGHSPELGQQVAFDFMLSPNKKKPPQANNVRVLKSAAALVAEDELKKALETEQAAKFTAGLDALAKVVPNGEAK